MDNLIGKSINCSLYTISDDHNLNNSNVLSSTKCVHNSHINLKEYCDQLKDMIENKGEGLPLGHIYLWPFPTPPDGSIQLNGSTYSRELYSDLWNLIQSKGWYKPETEWQQIASENNGGYCPWYSDGDGTTTFRTPKFAPYQKLALASGDAGKYYEAGLPNIVGDTAMYGGYSSPTGAFYMDSTKSGQGFNAEGTNATIPFDASRSNSIYGNSTTVQPESHDWIVCVVAFGTATNIGSVDIANVMTAVSQVQAGKLDNTTVHLVETWKSDDSTSWYRKYSDGWIEQGGISKSHQTTTSLIITLPIEFKTTVYNIYTGFSGTDGVAYVSYVSNKKQNSFTLKSQEAASKKCMWLACGY